MSKRKIVLTIDCNAKTCGKCSEVREKMRRTLDPEAAAAADWDAASGGQG